MEKQATTQSHVQQLVEAAQEGNEEAFAELYEMYYDRLTNYIFRRVLDQAIAQDIVSNTWIKILKNLKKFSWRHDQSFNAWVYRIASNELNQYFRNQSRYAFVAPEDMEQYFSMSEFPSEEERARVETEIDTKRQFVHVHKVMSQLKERDQDLLHLYFFENLNHREIASALEMNESTVRVSIHRALKQLKSKLGAMPEFANGAF